MRKVAPIHQTFHGYDGGHRLLASSGELPAADRRLLDRLSDSPGAHIVGPRSGFLTGYPLPSGRYALARTREATGSSRPNTVWTHSLLLEAEHLDPSQDPRHYLTLLSNSPATLGSYRQPIRPPINNTQPTPGPLDPFMAILLDHLMSCDGGVYAVIDDAREQHEQITLAIWALLWPKLRRSFSFCTAAAEPRTLKPSDPFDLQWTVSSQRRKFRDLTHATPGTHPSLAADLLSSSQDDVQLRSYLAYCGNESHLRTTLTPLAQLYLDASINPQASAPIIGGSADLIAKLFPSPEQMRRLKSVILGPRRDGPWIRWPEALVLMTVLDPAHSHSLLAADMDAPDRTRQLWRKDFGSARGLLRKQLSRRDRDDSDPASVASVAFSEYARTVATVVSDHDVAELAVSDPELLCAFALERGELLSANSLWHGTSEALAALLGYLSGDESPLSMGALALAAISPSPLNDETALPTTPQHLAELIDAGALADLLSEVEGATLRPGVDGAFTTALVLTGNIPIEAALKGGLNSSQVRALINRLPTSMVASGTLARLWPVSLLQTVDIGTSAALLHRYLSGTAEIERTAAVFPIVHAALARQELSAEAWSVLSAVLPAVPAELEWDRALRLRLAVILALQRWGTSVEGFAGLLSDQHLANLLREMTRRAQENAQEEKKKKKEKNFLERLFPW